MRACLKPALLCVFSIGVVSCVSGLAEQTLRTEKKSFPAAGLTMARLATGAGSLRIAGTPGASAIEVMAEYRGSNTSPGGAERILENLKLTMEVRGDTFYLRSEQVSDWAWNASGRIDLVLTLPPEIGLDVDDGSGSIEISDMAGRVRVEDGSGGIDLERIQGDVSVRDGSGSISIRGADRNVEIEDGSGDIHVRDVGGDVRIEDSSGSIDVEQVRGDFIVPHDGSGSIRFSGIDGRVDIPKRRK